MSDIRVSFVRVVRGYALLQRAGKDFGANPVICDAVADAFEEFAKYIERLEKSSFTSPPTPESESEP